jgi:hypothetical protein
MRLAEREVVEGKFGEGFTGAEAEVLNDIDIFFRGPFGLVQVLGGCSKRAEKGKEGDWSQAHRFHFLASECSEL